MKSIVLKKKEPMVKVGYYFPTDVDYALQEACRATGQSQSKILIALIEHHLADFFYVYDEEGNKDDEG